MQNMRNFFCLWYKSRYSDTIYPIITYRDTFYFLTITLPLA